MPVFARTKLILQENCFDFTIPEMYFKYKGKDPQLAYNKIRELFWTVFGVKETERVQEVGYNWDKNGKRENFSVDWHVTKDMDRHSYLYFKIRMKGFAEEGKDSKEGEVNVDIVAHSRTEYPQDNIWERSIFYEIARTFWHKVFYQEKRDKYMDICREISTKFRNELKSFFNLIPRGG